MKYYLLFFIIVFSSFVLRAQNIQLIVKSGSAFVTGQLIKPGKIKVLNESDSIKIISSSLILVSLNSTILELDSKKEYTFTDIVTLFNKAKSFNKAFVDVILNQDYAKKKQSLVSTRGVSASICNFIPYDSITVLSDSISIFVVDGACEFVSDIKIIKKGTSDTIILSTGNSKIFKIKCPAPGEYTCIFTLRNSANTTAYNNLIFIPDPILRNSILLNYQNYSNSLSGFSNEMMELLLREFEFQNRLYIK